MGSLENSDTQLNDGNVIKVEEPNCCLLCGARLRLAAEPITGVARDDKR